MTVRQQHRPVCKCRLLTQLAEDSPWEGYSTERCGGDLFLDQPGRVLYGHDERDSNDVSCSAITNRAMSSFSSAKLSKPRPRAGGASVFKKLSGSEKNSLDLDRPWDEQSTGFVSNNYDNYRDSIDSARGLGLGSSSPTTARSARDASFSSSGFDHG